jgi:hypothetical protein
LALAVPFALACAFATVAASAQQAPSSAGVFTGSVSLGVRSVEIDGTETKYREDVNLDDGPRVFGAQLSYVAPSGETPVDRVDFDAANLGGDPFESIHLGVRKYGAYDLKLDRRRSEYFYDDTILPAAFASVSGSTGGDFHTFDFERVRSTAAVDIDVTPATRVSLGLENQTRTGDSTTTLTVERDEFDLAKPLDETLSSASVGVRHAWGKVTVIADEQVRDFENTSELFLPGASAGRNPADTAALQFFSFDQSYDFAVRSHSLRLLAAPTPRLDLEAGWHLDDLELDLNGNETASGTSASGVPFETSRSGPGTVGRDTETLDASLGFALTERVRLVSAARRSTLEQDGELTIGANIGASAWDIETSGYEIGAELALSRIVTVAAGWSRESRSTSYGWLFDAVTAARDADTDRAGYFVRLMLELESGLELTASVEDNSIDDPFTLASPTSSKRYKATARRRWNNGLALSANYRRTDVDNDVSNWLAATEQADARLMYQRQRFRLSGGYTRIDLDRSVQQAVAAGARVTIFPIDYAARSSFRDVTGRWEIGDRFAVGGELRAYDNRGSFRLTRDDFRAFFDVRLGAQYSLQVAYRELEYVEDAYDGYDANILELAFGLRL